MAQQATQLPSCSVKFTDAAVTKIEQFLATQEDHGLALRIRVVEGGCSGLRCRLSFEKHPSEPDSADNAANDVARADRNDDDGHSTNDAGAGPLDSVLSFGSFSVLIDATTGPYLDGAVIDYIGTPSEDDFAIDNLNAQGGCPCGDSFH